MIQKSNIEDFIEENKKSKFDLKIIFTGSCTFKIKKKSSICEYSSFLREISFFKSTNLYFQNKKYVFLKKLFFLLFLFFEKNVPIFQNQIFKTKRNFQNITIKNSLNHGKKVVCILNKINLKTFLGIAFIKLDELKKKQCSEKQKIRY